MKLNRIDLLKALTKMSKAKNQRRIDSGEENLFTSQQIELMRNKILFHILCYVIDSKKDFDQGNSTAKQENLSDFVDRIIETTFGVIDDESSVCVETFACIKVFDIERKLR